MNPPVLIQTLTNYHRGTIAQAAGLAASIARLSSGEVVSSTLQAPAWVNVLPPACGAFLCLYRISNDTNQPVDIVIGCGEKAQAAILSLKKKRGCFAVYIQRPRASEKKFDAIVAPRHDYSVSEIKDIENNPQSNVILTVGAVGLIDADTLGERRLAAQHRFSTFPSPRIAVLIGGNNRAYRFDVDTLIEQLQSIVQATQATLLLTSSRRSVPTLLPALQQCFGDAHFIWDGQGDNPYLDMMAAADAFCVTLDSVNMISEACTVGRPVYLLPLSIKNGWRAARRAKKFNRFHQDLIDYHHARFWLGEWMWFSSSPLAETARTANEIWERYNRKIKEQKN